MPKSRKRKKVKKRGPSRRRQHRETVAEELTRLQVQVGDKLELLNALGGRDRLK
jgi:hypothetical protein